MIAEGYTGQIQDAADRPSRLDLFPFSTFESFCEEEWIGRESEWFRISNILHWTLSHLGQDSASRVLLLQPGSAHLETNLALHLSRGQMVTLGSSSSRAAGDVASVFADLEARLAAEPAESVDLILATALFSTGAAQREERSLIRACHRVLKDGRPMLATFPLEDALGNPISAQNIQFLDAMAAAGFEQLQITGCEGIAHHLGQDFWDKLRKQGHAAFDAVLNALAPLSDSPSVLWMSKTAFYSGIKR